MTWSLPPTEAAVTSLRRAGSGAFMVQLPCACAVVIAVPSIAHSTVDCRSFRTLWPIVSSRGQQRPIVSHPTFELAQCHLPEHQHARRAVVETGDGEKILAAVAMEDAGVVDRNLLQRLQAIGGKSRRDHDQILDAALGELPDGVDGCGLKPLGAAEARLERQHQLVVSEFELLGQQPRRHY